MPFSLSPAVQVVEKDLTTVIPAVATSIGGIAGSFTWGPVEEPTLVTFQDELVSKFGKPTAINYKDWWSASNFLDYTSNLQVVRVLGIGALNSGDTAGILIKNDADFDANITTIEASLNAFVAKHPGTAGNDIVVDVSDTNNFATWAYAGEFDFAPVGTQFWAVVLKAGVIVERFQTDTSSVAVDFRGKSTYCQDVFKRSSQYAYCVAANVVTDNAGAAVTNTLASGADGAAAADADYQLGLDQFANPDQIDVNLLMQGGASPLVGKYAVQTIAEGRLDAVACVSPNEVDVVNNAAPETALKALRDVGGDFNFSSSYGVMDGNYKYQYDKFNDKFWWVPLNGDIAGIMAHTDFVTDPWFSPGGLNRGKIKNVVKLAFNPNKAQRDTLYSNAINPIVSFKGDGPVLFGDKTMQSKPSAFDRINVRRLFIVLEKAIATAAKFSLFEFNDTFTRARFVQMVEPFLRDVQGRRGVTDFKVIANETNNTPAVIDSNNFVADILIKPARSINVITLNFVAVNTGVDFNEIVG